MAEHTLGPWAWEFFKDDHDRGQLQQYPIALSGQGPLSDVLVASSNYADEIFIRIEPANAFLIAASPELLASCREMREFIRTSKARPGETPYDILCRASFAIAKATGGTL